VLNRILTTRLPLLAYHPLKTYDLDFFKNIWLAGAMPVLDTEFIGTSELSDLLRQLKNQNLRHGIRIYAEDEDIWDYFNQHPADLPECVIVAYHDPDSLVKRQAVNAEILMMEIYDPGLEAILKDINPHGIIVKGREAGGRASCSSSFMLSQYYAQKSDLPYFVHGGVGFHTAPGFFAAGAAGLVLDDQLYLAEDSPVSGTFKQALGKMEETDTVILDGDGNTQHRVFAKPGTKIVQELIKEISIKKAEGQNLDFIKTAIEQNMASLGQDHDTPMQALFYLGQDAVFARHFAKRGSGIAQMIRALFSSVGNALNAVEQFDPLTEHTSLAKEHGTRFPITQGPMANISDNKDFAKAVYDNGGLPFFALGSLPIEIADTILPEKSDDLPTFGAGMIGIKAFNPTLDHHLELIKTKQTPFALFAGGIPSQINELEACGTRAYLHTPMPGVLKNAFEKGARRFILEGNEAGGHIGSLSSMVLWEVSIETLLDLPLEQRPDVSVLFAGGIISAAGSHFISAMTALLAKEGVKIGVQLGTAYLFTKEIVETGAITPVYQQVVQEHNCTTIIGSTVGLACRTANTNFAGQIMKNEHCRLADGTMALGARKSAFEKDNLGSLLIGAKGKTPDFGHENAGQWILYNDEEQLSNGNFMTGEGLLFFEDQTTIARIHEELFLQKDAMIARLNALEVLTAADGQINDDIAVVGMGCVFPDAHDTDTFWRNILDKKYSIGKVPDSRWEESLYYDPDPKAEDKSYTQVAGLVNDFQFDNERFGYSPAKASKLSRSQQMLLHAAYQAVENANLLTDDNRIAKKEQNRAAVIVATCLGNEMASDLHFKYFFPEIKDYLRNTPEFNALSESEQNKIIDQLRIKMSQGSIYEPVHGVTLNMEAARIAHHLGISGTNYVVDAACATALSAIDCGIHELLSGTHDMVIAGGINTNMTPESFVGFCKMGTLSPNGSFPFDERADGFVLGEGAGVLVLKRLKDAIREKDPILGVIKGVASSSDGKGKGIAAPDKAGQILAFQRCHEKIKSEFSPGMVQFIEAHGTGTRVGDAVEMDTLRQVYDQGAPIGVSTIKSQIGHLLGAAGMAGMIKTLLALNHKTLPPNGTFEKISPKIDIADSSLFVLGDPEPWDAPANGPRMAAVSAYGFGGINYHAVVSEFNEADTTLSRRIFTDLDHDPNDDRIVFSGIGVVLPKAGNKDAFWDAMVSGQKAYHPMPAERLANACYAEEDEKSGFHLPMMNNGIVDDFMLDPKTFKIPPSAMTYMDRAQLFGLDAAGQALEQAGIKDKLTSGNKIGAILGTISGTRNVESIIRTRIPLLQRMIQSIPEVDENTLSAIAGHVGDLLAKRYPAMTGDSIPGKLSNIVSARISKHYNIQGTNFVVDASCASATMALDVAVKNLRAGDLDVVLTGGVDTNLYPGVLLSFKRLGILAETEPCLFDNDANGYVMGEGAACLVVTTYKYAKQNDMPILGELKCLNTAASAPEHLLSPSENKYENVISNDTGAFKTRKPNLAYLDVFGVSHPFLDLVEKQAIEKSLNHPVAYGNIKTEFGYFKAANPAVVMTRLLMMSDKGVLLPTHGYRPHSTLIEKDSLLHPVKEITPLADGALLGADVNGIGGNHAHVIIGRLPRFLRPQDASVSVEQPAVSPGVWPDKVRIAAVTALLSGQGAQSAGMLKSLYDALPDVKALMDQGDAIFQERRGTSLLEIMNAGGAPLNQTENTQPAIFLSTAAIYHALHLKGFEPDFYIGHSVGEYSALYCAGLVDFTTAMNLVISRSDFMARAAAENPGGIMVVFDGEKTAQDMISTSGVEDIWLVNKNSEKQTAIAGTTKGIDLFCAYLKDRDVFHKKLALSAPFHTPILEPAAANMAKTLEAVKFNIQNAHKIISNLTAKPYPADEQMIRVHLARQIVSPVEFVESVKGVHAQGCKRFIEIGPGRLLCNLLKNISIENPEFMPTADAKKGELDSFNLALERFIPKAKDIAQASESVPLELKNFEPKDLNNKDFKNEGLQKTDAPKAMMSDDISFNTFLEQNKTLVQEALHREYQAFQQKNALAAIENLGLYTDSVCIAGVSVGLPGKGHQVFNEKNFDRILAGNNFIEPLSQEEKNKIVDMNITRVYKQPSGNARFVDIVRTQDVIQLAGKLGYFDLSTEYGISRKFDLVDELAMAAGLEALKDAHIPLVQGYKKTSTGSSIPDALVLPEEMQETTGVIMTGIFPGFETLLHHLNAYYYNKFYVKPYEELENIYYHLMENLADRDMKDVITDWFFKIRERRKVYGQYKFERNILFDIVSLGGAHFAQLIRAKGPNIHLSGACASTTQAIGMAEDWIRNARCDRVIVIGGEAATSDAQMPWVGSGFLAMGAATSKEVVSEAAKPFDEDRNGTILGSGAVGIVVEREDTLKRRGLNGQARILGSHIGNSAFHPSRIDVGHLAEALNKFVDRVERQNAISRKAMAEQLVFMSHETFTPARGGSASAEVNALKNAFPDNYKQITITNTKGYTGHTLGAGIEDAVLVKGLQKNTFPPVANLDNVPAEFSDLNFTKSVHGDYRFGLHFSAGFGSHFAFLLIDRVQEADVENNPVYHAWLARITGSPKPRLGVINKTLCVLPRDKQPETAQESKTEKGSGATGHDAPESRTSKKRDVPKQPVAAPAEQPEKAAGNATATDVLSQITDLIANQTGYTHDMLEPDLDLEADLGIDTVKQVETFGKITKSFGLTAPEDISLSELNTIRKIAEYIGSCIQTEETPKLPESGTADQVVASGADTGPDITGEITAMIAEQTGYTIDMLEPDLDLEVDLGIDTVKQVETFGKITKEYGLSVPEDINLSELNTISKISEYIQAEITGAGNNNADAPSAAAVPRAQAPETEPSAPSDKTQMPDDPDHAGIQRYCFGLRNLPNAAPANRDFEGQTYLITMDNQGFGQAVAALIKENKGHVICVGNSEHDDYTVDLNTPEAAEAVISRIKADHEGISGIFFLHPLDFVMNSGENPAAESASVKFLFLLCKAFGSRLDESHGRLAALSVQSALARFKEPAPDQIFPVFSGISGLLKTVAKEYPQTGVKLVEFMDKNDLADMTKAASLFMDEVFSMSTCLEVGIEKGVRFGIRAKTGRPATSQPQGQDTSVIKDTDTLLVTGGAAGITYELLKAVIRPDMNLVILGRSRVEDELEISVTDAMDDTQIMAALKSIHPKAKPVELKNKTAGLRRILTARANLAQLRTGVKAVDYHAVDVTDPNAVLKAVNQYDRIDGVIHAAGVDRSIMIEKKSMDDFNLVFDTKVKGMANVLAAIENKNCRYIIGFSSITARFGNEAQSDYTAGNDMMGAMIQASALKTPGLTYKVFDWTAWAEIGMAAQGTIEAVLKEKGIAFLPVAQGVRFFQEELDNPVSNEVLIGAPPEKNPAAFDPDGLLAIGPFLDTVETDAGPDRLQFKRLLEADRDLFLFDHARKGVPLFLGATGLETMAEAALEYNGAQGRVLEVSDFKIPYAIKLLKNRPKHIEVFAEKHATGLITTEIHSVFTPPGGKAPAQDTLHFQGKFKIGTDSPALDEISVPALSEFKVDAEWQKQIYHPDRLFMDGLFRSVDQLATLDQDSLVTVVQWRPGREFFKGQTYPEFATPVVIMDAMFQTGGILEFFTSADVMLPYAIRKLSFAGAVLPNTPYFCVTRRLAQGSDTKTYHMQLADPSGRVIIDIQDFQMVRVDRLAEKDRPDLSMVKQAGKRLMAG
jgi:malonyl CoA-acyl carrier protein transacylase